MTAADLARPTALALAVVLGLLGGWVLAEARELPDGVRRLHRATGLLLLVLSASAFNRGRIDAVMRAEDASVVGLRMLAVAVGVAVLALHVRRRGR